jgi:murein DD-endopeptidase MepM/ murein hydrolase activator NlpD
MMKMTGRRSNAAILAGLLFGLLSATPLPTVMADQLTDKQAQQDQLNSRAQQDQNAINALQAQQNQIQARLNVLNGQVANSEAELARENAHLDTILGEIDATQRQLDSTRAEQAHQQQLLNQRTRTLYKQGGDTSFMDSLFTANNFGDLVNRYILMSDVTHANQVLVLKIKAAKDEIERLVVVQGQQRDAQAATVKTVQEKSGALRAQYAEQSALKGQLAATQRSKERDLAEAKAAQAQVASEIATLVAARNRAHSSGVFAWPGVQGPITQGFGCTDFRGEPPPPSGYSCPASRPYFHAGIDIAGPYGAEIDATDGGIAYAYPGNSGYGNHVIIVHQNGFTSLYGHMSGFAVGSGTPVAKGQRIGFEGSTGFSTGAHLHFEIRLNEGPVNPCNYVGC